MKRIFEANDGPALAAGRLWGVARPVVRRTAAETGAMVHEAISRTPYFVDVETGRTSYLLDRGDRAKRRARLSRLFRSGKVLVPPDARFDYEAIEPRAFAKAVGFGMPGGLGPKRFATLAQGTYAKNGAIQGSYAGAFAASPARPWLAGDFLDEGPPPMTMAKPNDWREAALRRAAEAGAFEDVLREHKYRSVMDRPLQRACAEKASSLVGRTLHRKSWVHVCSYVWEVHRALGLGWNVGGIAIPRLRWDDAADERAKASGATP